MKDVAHDGIEVGDDVRVAVLVYLRDAFLECGESLVVVLLHVVCKAFEIIKRHVIGVVLLTGMTESDNLVVFLLRPHILQE